MSEDLAHKFSDLQQCLAYEFVRVSNLTLEEMRALQRGHGSSAERTMRHGTGGRQLGSRKVVVVIDFSLKRFYFKLNSNSST
jgi:hypothetical protein